jgi:hypothetical protein
VADWEPCQPSVDFYGRRARPFLSADCGFESRGAYIVNDLAKVHFNELYSDHTHAS